MQPKRVIGRPFQPGQVSNPLGRPSLPPEIRAARKANQAALIRLVQQYFGLTANEADKRLSGPETLQLEEAVQGQILKAKEGDTHAFKYLIEIMCGKIPELDSDEVTEEDLILLRRLKQLKLERDAK